MEETKQVFWKIDMEFICNLARTWLWDEDKDYEKCEELLLSIMEGNELTLNQKKEIVVQILEGRKIIKGINTGNLEDDNENIRPLYKLAEKYKKQADELALLNDIESHPWMYVDIYAGGYSIYGGKGGDGSLYGSCRSEFKGYTINQMINWRRYGQNLSCGSRSDEDESTLESGTLLLAYPWFAKTVLNKPCKSAKEVLVKLTEYYNKQLEEWKCQGIDFKDMEPRQKRIYERNMAACRDYNMVFPYNNPLGQSDLNSKGLDYYLYNKIKEEEKERRINELTIKRLEEFKKEEEVKNKKPRSSETEWYKNIPEPDKKAPEYKGEFFDMYGWISPDGTWYSCGFAGHGVKADAIIRANADMKEKFKEYYEKHNNRVHCDDEFLEDNGWIKYHNPMGGDPFVDAIHFKKLNFAQKDRIQDIQKQFGLGIYSDNPNFEEEDDGRW